MQLEEFLNRLSGVKRCGSGYSARCPAHDDKTASLTVSQGEDGRILVCCQAGCSTEAVVREMGLSMRDLFPDGDKPRPERTRPRNTPREDRGNPVAQYDYTDPQGNLLARKIRWERWENGKKKKTFTWSHPEGENWKSGRNGVAVLYRLPELAQADTVFLCEGEKDVDNLVWVFREQSVPPSLTATCSPDGAGTGNKWKDEYTPYFKGKTVYILEDNDQVGRTFAQFEAQKLAPVAAEVKVLNLAELWPDLPEHGDISDVMEHLEPIHGCDQLLMLAESASKWEPSPPEKDPFLSSFHSLADFPEEEASWLVERWLPEGQITLLAADGGTGKTTLWCDLVAAVSSGRPCLLDPPGTERTPQTAAFFSTEDSVRKKLRKQLREAGANLNKVVTLDLSAESGDAFRELKLGSERLREFVAYYRPTLCVFDPIQGFLPKGTNMGNRNDMRECMAPLIALGEEYGTTFLIVCHTNKRTGASGRNRLADSADLWDVARSVLMMGTTGESGQRYLSNEKNNYTTLQETLLLSFGETGTLTREGTTWKRDREFMQDTVLQTSAPKREDCKQFILDKLAEADNTLPAKELERLAKQAGYSERTLRRAKEELKESSAIVYKSNGFGDHKQWTVTRTEFSEPERYLVHPT